MRLGQLAESLANERGLTARGASIAANGSADTVRHMKHGHVPDCISLHHLAERLGVSLQEMMRQAMDKDPEAPGSMAPQVKKAPKASHETADMLDIRGLAPAAKLALMTLATALRQGDNDQACR